MTHLNITNIKLGPKYAGKLAMLNALSTTQAVNYGISRIPAELLENIKDLSLGQLDTKIKSGNHLSLKEAFQGMMLVIASTNNHIRTLIFPGMRFEEAVAKGSYFLTLMAAKESFSGLNSDEITGIAAAGFTDLAYTPSLRSVYDTSGMGADRGWGTKDLKTINVSTLTSVVLASMGQVSMKHGSYGNTTRVGSTDVLEQFGARLNIKDAGQVEHLLSATGFWFNDAHSVKTLHYLSHLLKVETINHIVGPMTPPIAQGTTFYKVMGVNHYVHPETIAKAFVKLHKLGVIKLGGVAVIGGVDKEPSEADVTNHKWFLQHSRLDELSPEASVVSFASGGRFLGNRVIKLGSHFGPNVNIRPNDLKVANAIPTLMHANQLALTGKTVFADYLACNVALALLVKDLGFRVNLGKLPKYKDQAQKMLVSGKANELLTTYINLTGGQRKDW